MKHAQNPHIIVRHIIDENIVRMDDEFARSFGPPRPAHRRMPDQVSRLIREDFIERERRCRIIQRNMFADHPPLMASFNGPMELHA